MIKSYTFFILTVISCFFSAAFAQPPAQKNYNDFEKYRSLLAKHPGNTGATAKDIIEATITDAYTDELTGISYVYLQQTYKNIKVYNAIISSAFRNDDLVSVAGSFVKNIEQKAASSVPSITPAGAVNAAAAYLGLVPKGPVVALMQSTSGLNEFEVASAGIARRDIAVKLFWTVSNEKEKVTLSWNVNIDELRSANWWNVRIDAATGTYLEKDNWTVNENHSVENFAVSRPFQFSEVKARAEAISKNTSETFSPPTVTTAIYKVIPYPVESPNYGSPGNVTDPWLAAGAGNNAVTYGWHFNGATNYNITRGNNVFAYLDVANNNTPSTTTNYPDTSTTAIPSLTFLNTPIFSQEPGNSTNQTNKKFALDNLFYWNNIIHDVMYQYGFTEAAGNFQDDNIARGGAGNDHVEANAQDGSGTNNANFGTPSDGVSGRMQMYLFSGIANVLVNAPVSIAGNKRAIEGSFTTAVSNKLKDVGSVTNTVIYYNDISGGGHTGCVAPSNAAALSGHIALIDAFGSATCTQWSQKIINAQNAGAVAVIMYSNTAAPFNFGTNDATSLLITIPTVCISNSDGLAIITQLNASVVVNVTLSSVGIDGDIDNGVIAHEYGHGISNRLVGGPSNVGCLSNAEQGGEGWSDYFGLMLTTNWATATLTDGALARPIGTYVLGQLPTDAGIRRHPYSTNLVINPITYTDMATSTEVHNIGEIWCSAIWDMTWNIIQQTGSITPNLYNSAGTGGNAIALNLVMTGLKLQACGAGYIDARNAILTADSILYNNAHRCAIWNAFARRGMGASASQGSASSATDQTAATDLPSRLQIARLAPAKVTATTQTTITHTVSCDCQPLTGYVVRDTIPAGFTYTGSTPTGTLAGNVLSFPATNFASLETKTFAINLQAPPTGCDVDSVINDNRETSTTGGFTGSGTNAWTTSTAKPYNGTSSWFINDAATVTSGFLTSANTVAAAGKNLSIFSFRHFFNTESVYDGGVVEYSTNGTLWTDASSLFFPNTYTNTFVTGTALAGRRGFSGANRQYDAAYINASSFGTTPVQFRFRMESDNGVGSIGWYVDDIVRANGCGAFLKTGIYNGSNVMQDTALTPVFVTQSVVGLHLLSFDAVLQNGHSLLDWHTATENLLNYRVEWSSDNANWSSLGTVAAQNHLVNNYSYVHTTPGKGNNYYRLRMNEANGTFNYSPVRILNLKDGNTQPLLVPNPANDYATLFIPRDVQPSLVKIYDAIGSLVADMKISAGTDELKIPVSKFAPGVYVVVINGTKRWIQRLVVGH